MKRILNLFLMTLLSFVYLVGCNVPSSPPDQPPAPEIVFFLESDVIDQGQCTYLHWEIQGGVGVVLNGEEIPVSGGKEVCPEGPQVFELQVDMGTHIEYRIVELVVNMDPPTGDQSSDPDPSGTHPVVLVDLPPGAPAYLGEAWIAVGGPPGGLGYDIRIRPDNPEIMFVTDAHAGIHKSENGGQTWFPSNEGITPTSNNDIPIFCLTIGPHNYDIIWAGTQVIGHVYRSTDNGATWQERDTGITENGRSVRGITIDPQNANVVYAATEVEAITWANEMHTPYDWGVGGEVYKSTDSGLSWQRIWYGDNLARYIWVHPEESDLLYVSTGIFDRTAANGNPDNPANGNPDNPNGVGIVRSSDGGASWEILDQKNGLSGLIIPSMFMHPTDPNILLAGVSNPGVGGVFVTRDGGDTWQRCEFGPSMSDAVEISTSNPDIWYSATEGQISRSNDSGENWDAFPMETEDRSAGMPIDLQVDPRDPYRIFVNNYGGGNFLSLDGGATWLDASTGYTGAAISGMIVIPGDGSKLLVGANTGAFLSNNSGSTWEGTPLPSAEKFILSETAILASDSGGNIWRSEDWGMSWNKIPILDTMAEFIAGRLVNDVVSMRAFTVAPSDPQVMYTGFTNAACLNGSLDICREPMPNIYRSQDGGSSWQELTGAPFTNQAVLNIAVHPSNSSQLYAATVNGLYSSINSGTNWTKVAGFKSANQQIPIQDSLNPMATGEIDLVTDVVFDPFDYETIFATTQRGGVWRSADGGQTWEWAGAGMDANELIVKLLPDPVHPGLIYAASRLSGVYYSTDGGVLWQHLNQELPVRNINNLALSQNGSVLYAGINGRGVFRLSAHPLEP